MAFEKVTRQKAKARIGLTGTSGAGKTVSALLLAYGIAGDWNKVALIDTEHERARFYANRSDLGIGEFLYQSFAPPYSPERYIQLVVDGANAVGADGVVIIDSFSHAWDNEGGVLDIKSKIERQSSKTSFSAWDEAGKVQNNLVNHLLSANCHIIVTMRSKMAYAMEVNEKGKTVPVKIGLAPIQRENTEYEFDIVFNIARNHVAIASKDTTFLDNYNDIITMDLGKQLKDWLDKGVDPERCTACSQIIKPTQGRTVQQIVDGTIKNYGRKLCWGCMAKEIKNNASKTVSG